MQKAAPPVSMVTLRPQRLLTKPAMMEKKAPAGIRQEGSVGRVQQQPFALGGAQQRRLDTCNKGQHKEEQVMCDCAHTAGPSVNLGMHQARSNCQASSA